MAATGYTPISLYYSTTASTAPSAGNLIAGELAINTNDGILYYKDSSGVVQKIGTKGGVGSSSTTQVLYNNAGAIAGSANLTFNGTTLTTANDASISGLTVGKGYGAQAQNTALGISALPSSSLTGNYNTAVGYQSLLTNTSGTNNTATGYNSLAFNTTGSYNSAYGLGALAANTTGANNTASGWYSLASNTTASDNTAVGYQAAYTANGSGTYLTAVGSTALKLNTTGVRNTAVGFQSQLNNTTGSYNSSFGLQSLSANTTGSNNTALGEEALVSNTTASNNTAVGYQAGYSQIGGGVATYNAYFGDVAGYSTTSGIRNVFIGSNTGYSNTTGSYNTYVGGSTNCGYFMTTGSKNTIIGGYSGNQGGLDIRTASNYIVLSDGDGNPKFYVGGATGFFRTDTVTARGLQTDASQTYPSADNTMSLGLGSFRWSVVYAATAIINTSDANQKQQIRSLDDTEKAVAKSIKGLIKTFKFNDSVAEKGDGARIHVGVIAQEVQSAFIAEGLDPTKYAMFCSDTWYEVDGKNSGIANQPYTAETEGAVQVTRLGIRYDQLLAFVISTL